jgi:hypothetical protein
LGEWYSAPPRANSLRLPSPLVPPRSVLAVLKAWPSSDIPLHAVVGRARPVQPDTAIDMHHERPITGVGTGIVRAHQTIPSADPYGFRARTKALTKRPPAASNRP